MTLNRGEHCCIVLKTMERCVLLLTAAAFMAVGANIVIQLDINRPVYISNNEDTEVREGDAEVTCSPPELCRADIQENRIVVQTVPEVFRDLIMPPLNDETDPDETDRGSPEVDTISPWRRYKEEVKSKRKNRKKKDRKASTSTSTTTTTEAYDEAGEDEDDNDFSNSKDNDDNNEDNADGNEEENTTEINSNYLGES